MTLGEDHVLEQDNTSTKDDDGDFGRVFVGLDFNNVLSFKFVDGFQAFGKFDVGVLDFEIDFLCDF
jgi:hypothetical protein